MNVGFIVAIMALLVALAVGALIYIVPAVLAFHNRKRNAIAIAALNLFLGWTLVGWVAALVWALTVEDTSEGGNLHDHGKASPALPMWLLIALAIVLPLVLLLPLLGLVGWYLWPKSAPRAVVVNETVRREGPVVVDRTEVVETQGNKVVADVVEETIKLAPDMAEALKVGEGLTGLFGNLGKVLGTVTNEETARAAIPQLNDYAPVLESLQKSTVALPEAGRSSIVELVTNNIGALQKVVDTVMAIPGV